MAAEKCWPRHPHSCSEGQQKDLVRFVGCRQPEASAAEIRGNQTAAAVLGTRHIPAVAGEILGVAALQWEKRIAAFFAAAAAAVDRLAGLVREELESRKLAGTILLSRYNYPTTKHPSVLVLL